MKRNRALVATARKRCNALVIILAALAALLGVTVNTASPAVANPVTAATAVTTSVDSVAATTDAKPCVSNIKNRDAVILVHGLFSSRDAWGKDDDSYSLPSNIRKQFPSAYVDRFDYKAHNVNWVDNPNIGPKLAERINCLAASTHRKVIVIGHSMGGLATRYALNYDKQAAKNTGLVITIGTPHLGSLWANGVDSVLYTACHPVGIGSLRVKQITIPTGDNGPCSASAFEGLSVFNKKITSLAKFPSSIPVESIAGDATLILNDGFHKVNFPFYGDTVVNTVSALQEMAHPNQGGGEMTARCSGNWPWELHCWHSGLTHHQPVEDQVVKSIAKFLSTQPTPLTFHGMTINLPPGWKTGTVYGNKGQGVRTTGKCVRKDYCQGFLLFNRFTGRQNASPTNEYDRKQFWHPGNDANGCMNQSANTYISSFPQQPQRVSTADVGGKLFNYTEWKVDCYGSDNTTVVSSHIQKVWYDPNSKMYIVDEFNTPGLWDILKKATWEPYPYLPIPGKFVGTWHVHGANMVIKSDGTGTYDWNNGACAANADITVPGTNCEGYVKIRVIHDSGVVIPFVDSKPWFKTWDHSPLPSNLAPAITNNTIGETIGTFAVEAYRVLVDLDADPSEGNPYFCDPKRASSEWLNTCN